MSAVDFLWQNRQWVALILLATYAVKVIFTYARLRHIRGPPLTGFSNGPHSLAMLKGNCHLWYAEVNEKYGKIARIAPNILMTSSPEVWAHLNIKPEYSRSDVSYLQQDG
jgi:hypothetical protein